jgi:hypothetical protein
VVTKPSVDRFDRKAAREIFIARAGGGKFVARLVNDGGDLAGSYGNYREAGAAARAWRTDRARVLREMFRADRRERLQDDPVAMDALRTLFARGYEAREISEALEEVRPSPW